MRVFVGMFSHETNAASTIASDRRQFAARDLLYGGVKSTVHYRAAFEPLAQAILEVDAPGLSSSNLSRFEFKKVRRPIFPLDPI